MKPFRALIGEYLVVGESAYYFGESAVIEWIDFDVCRLPIAML